MQGFKSPYFDEPLDLLDRPFRSPFLSCLFGFFPILTYLYCICLVLIFGHLLSWEMEQSLAGFHPKFLPRTHVKLRLEARKFFSGETMKEALECEVKSTPPSKDRHIITVLSCWGRFENRFDL